MICHADQTMKQNGKTIAYTAILSFLLPTVILSAVFAYLKITPFGNRTLLVKDMAWQYLAVYGYYRRVFHGSEDFFYSLSMGPGGGTIGLFAYLLTSPLLIPLIFVKPTSFATAISLMCLLKAGLCGLSFGLFGLFHKAENGDCEACAAPSPVRILSAAVLSCCYALCAYALANIYNTFWIDVVAVFPLLALCHERMMEKDARFSGKWTILYVLCTAGTLYLNYYIAFMALLFIAIRTLMIHTGLKSMVRCLLSTLLGAGLVMVLMLPTGLSVFGSAKDTSIMEDPTQGAYVAPWRILVKLLPGQYNIHDLFSGLPNIYCGLIPVALTAVYLFSKRIGLRRKLMNLLMLGILLLSCSVDGLNLIWHVGMQPSGYLYRYSFLISFMILLCAQEVQSAFFQRQNETPAARPSGLRAAAVGAFCALQLTGLVLNTNHYLSVLEETEVPSMETITMQINARSQLWESLRNLDPGFYRAEAVVPFSENDPLMYGYCGIRHYSSIQQTDVRNFLIRLGFNDTGLYTTYTPQNTYTADVLLGLKYCAHPDHMEKNEGVLPLAYVTDLKSAANQKDVEQAEERRKELLEGRLGSDGDPFLTAQSLLTEAAGITGEAAAPQVFYRPEVLSSGDNTYKLKMTRTGALYLFIEGTNENPQNILVHVDGAEKGVFGNNVCREVIRLGEYREGDTAEIELSNLSEPWPEEKVLFVSEDTEEVDRATQSAREHEAAIQMHTSSHLTITADAEDMQIPELAVLLPYDTNWQCRVNGKRQETERFLGEFMKIRLPASGEKVTVDLKYRPAGLYAGCAVSLLCFAVLAVLLLGGAGLIRLPNREYGNKRRERMKS